MYSYDNETDKRAKHEVAQVSNMLNSFTFNERLFCEKFAREEHRTIQQSFTRLCIAWLEKCADDDYTFDDRNEASHRIAKEMLAHTDDISLPFI